MSTPTPSFAFHHEHDFAYCWQRWPPSMGRVESHGIPSQCSLEWVRGGAQQVSWSLFFALRDHGNVTREMEQVCTWPVQTAVPSPPPYSSMPVFIPLPPPLPLPPLVLMSPPDDYFIASDTLDDVHEEAEEEAALEPMDMDAAADAYVPSSDVDDDDDVMDSVHTEPTAEGAVLPPSYTQPIRVPPGRQPVMDTFLLAVILDQGVRLVDRQNVAAGFEFYDYGCYMRFAGALTHQKPRHMAVSSGHRMKALRVWLEPMGQAFDDSSYYRLEKGASHDAFRMRPKSPFYQTKLADRYRLMCCYIKDFL